MPIEFFLYPIRAAPINAKMVAAAPVTSQRVMARDSWVGGITEGNEGLLSTFVYQKIPSSQNPFLLSVHQRRII